MAYESELQTIQTPNDVQDSANTLSDGVWMRGQLSSASDVDYFRLDTTQAGLVTLNFSAASVANTAAWRVDLLNANGDLLRTLDASATDKLTATGVANKPTQVVISGVTSTVAVGDQFTLQTSGSDKDVFTVVSVDSRSADKYTVTLDKAYTGSAGGSVSFDPAWLLSTGASASLSALTAGTYYVRVTSATSWSDTQYQLRTSVQSSDEVLFNDDVADARSENSRLVAGLTHTGTLSDNSDVDTWLLTTAKGSSFTIDFTGSNADSKFHIKIQTWTVVNGKDVFTTAQTASGSMFDGQATGSHTYTIDASRYGSATTFVVSVSSDGLASGSGTGAYTLKASGSTLDLNDAPVLQVEGYTTPAVPDSLLDLTGTVVRSYGASATTKVALSSLFSATDADTAQTLSYQVWLTPATGSSASGLIKLEASDGSSSTYANGATLSAAQLATAYVYPGTVVGDLSLLVQAIDSSAAPDNSGHSAFVEQTLRVAASDAGVSASLDSTTALVEGAGAQDTGYSHTLTVKLTGTPTSDVTVKLVDSDSQFVLSRTSLTFSASQLEQQVTVTARDDGKVEKNQVGSISFVVTSADANYNLRAVTPLTLSLADPSNHAPTGSVTLPTDASQGTAITATTSTLADADGLGTLNYLWERSSNGVDWSTISGAAEASYTPTSADAGKSLRVKVSYIDKLGTQESVTSSATGAVVKTNEAPTTTDKSLKVAKGSSHTFLASEFPFTDTDSGDALGSIYLKSQPANGTLRFDGQAITIGEGYRIIAADIGKLVYTPAATASVGDSVTFSFAVSDRVEALSSAKTMTLQVGAANSLPTGSVKMYGPLIEGRTLTASHTLVDSDGLGRISYTWSSSTDGNQWTVQGTGSTHVLTTAEIGSLIRVAASYTDLGGNAETVSSSVSARVGKVFAGTSSADTLSGESSADDLSGGAGNDTLNASSVSVGSLLTGGPGNDKLVGASRADVAQYSGNRSDYQIAVKSGGLTVTDQRSGDAYDGTDTLSGINVLKFADGYQFVPAASQRVAMTGSETSHTIAVTASKLYNGSKQAETFTISPGTSAMVLAGDGDTVQLEGLLADYTYAVLGSQLQIVSGQYVTTVNLGGQVHLKTGSGTADAQLGLVDGHLAVLLGNQVVGATDFNVNAVVLG